MSQSPTSAGKDTQSAYLEAFNQLAIKIRSGQSFSGRERNCFFLNTGGLTFADASAAAVLDYPDDGRGSALTDWDGDGDLDVILSNRNAPRLRFLRNDTGSRGQWVAIRLTGDPRRLSPRDAIGARVVVETADGSRFARTLHAGDGFLSQGSKTLHFGLGAAAEIRQVTVRWPGGDSEVFEGVNPGAVWHLTQGGGVRSVPSRPVVIPATPPELPPSSETLRIRLSQPLKLPSLSYTDFKGNRQTLESLTQQGPVLLNLWATWCAPCAAELQDFAGLPANVTVVALSVDQLDGKSTATSETAAAFLEKRGVRGPSGWADAALVAELDRLLRESVYRHLRMPVPASFLIDKGGWLTVIYKGRASLEQMREDIPRLGAGEDEARALAVPFPGPWAGRTAFVSHVIAVAAAWRECGQPGEARAILEKFLTDNPPQPGDSRRAQQIADVLFRLGDLELEAGRSEAAATRFAAAHQANPALIPARIGQLRALAALGQGTELAAQVRDLAPTAAGPDALAVLAEFDARAGRFAPAVAGLREAVAKNPRFVPGLNALAWLLAAAPDDSVRDAPEALKLTEFYLQAPGAKENPAFLLTRAAALAGTGDFTAAAAQAEAALGLARQRGDREFLQGAAAIVESIRSSKPVRGMPSVP